MADKAEEKEIWKTYPDYPFIQASNLGRVRTRDRYVPVKGGGKRLVKGRILKQHKNRYGYMQVNFNVNGKQVNLLTHRIVATCFLPNPEHLEQVNHKDCNRANNSVDNLEWCSASYNRQYTEKYGKAFGCPLYAVNLETFEVIYFNSRMEAERKLGIPYQNICAVIKGRYKTVGGYWFTEDKNEITKEKIQEIKSGMSSGVIAINLRTLKVMYFESQAEASHQLKISHGNIWSVLRGKRHTAGDHWFCYADKNDVEKTEEKFGDEIAHEVEELMKHT